MSKKISLLGVMVALAFVLSYIEAVTIGGMLMPGIKVGLANIIVVITLWIMGGKEAFIVSLTRVILAGIMYGNAYTLIYSAMGAIGSLMVMVILKRKHAFSIKGISVAGAITHNVFQILVAVVLLRNKWLLITYLPWLLIGGVVMGLITGMLSEDIFKRIKLVKGKRNV